MWLLKRTRHNKGLAHALVSGTFLLCWIVFRLGMCGFSAWHLWVHFEQAWVEVSHASVIYCCISVPFLTVLNWFWFYKILVIALCPRGKKEKNQSEGDKLSKAQ